MKLEVVEKKTIEVRRPSHTCCDMMKMMLDERIYIPDYDGIVPQLYWFIKQPDRTLKKIAIHFCFYCGEKVE